MGTTTNHSSSVENSNGTRPFSTPAPATPKPAILCVVGLLLLGLFFTLINIDLPFVRISYLYGSAVEALFEHNFNPLPVIADEHLSYGRPIFFSLIAVPFAALFGLNASLILASYVGTAFFVIVALFFFKHFNRRMGIDQKFIPLELLMLFFNPLMMYQFWSSYPDTMLAGLILLAYLLTERILHEPNKDPRLATVALGVIIYVAILTKLFGAILGLAVPIYILLNARAFFQPSPYRLSRLIWMVGTFTVLGMLMLLALLGENPTLDFVMDGSRRYSTGYRELSSGLGSPSFYQIVATLEACIIGILFCLNITLIFLFTRFTEDSWPGEPAFKGVYLFGLIPLHFLLFRRTPRDWTPAAFCAVYTMGMIPFGDYLAYNIRYFIPIYPFLIAAMVLGYQNTDSALLRRGVLTLFFTFNLLGTLNYNVREIYNAVDLNLDLEAPGTDTNFWLDNLRMDEHLIVDKIIDAANEHLPENSDLYWDANYYGTSSYGVIEKLGFRRDFNFIYPDSFNDLPVHQTSYLARLMQDRRYRPLPKSIRAYYDITSYAHGLDKLTPKIALSAPDPDHTYALGEPITFKAELSERTAKQTHWVEFLVDGIVIETDKTAPYSAEWRTQQSGRYEIKARAMSTAKHGGDRVTTKPLKITVGVPTLTRYISHAADDVEENITTNLPYLTSSELDIVSAYDTNGPQMVGLRFRNIQWLKDQPLEAAYLQFTATRSYAGEAEFEIRAERTPDAPPMEDSHANLSSRTPTSAAVYWKPGAWTTALRGQEQRSPNLAPLFDELFALPDWKPGNDILLMISGYGERSAYSFERARGGESSPELILIGQSSDTPLVSQEGLQKGSQNRHDAIFGIKQSADQLYANHCALCHGKFGEGNAADYANALFNPDFLAIVDPQFLYHAIAEGRPGTPMSAWSIERGGPFSQNDIQSLVAYIVSHNTKEQRPINEKDKRQVQQVAQLGKAETGDELYAQHCASCHGKTGEGVVAPSLNNPTFLGTADNAFLYRSIYDGRRNTTMPSFADQLSHQDLLDLIAFMRHWDSSSESSILHPTSHPSSHPSGSHSSTSDALSDKAATQQTLQPSAQRSDEKSANKPAPLQVPHLRDLTQKIINPEGEHPNFRLRSKRFVPAGEVAKAMRAGQRMILVDARPPSDWQAARAEGAIPAPFYSIKRDASLIPNDGTWIIAYCACPHASSGQVVDELRRRGFKNTAILDEGIDYWIDKGYPTEYGIEHIKSR